jgi:CRISPR-associated protein Cas2
MARRTITNNRRVYLCSYDIADDKRRAKLFELLKDHGEHVQYSVFLCSLTKSEMKHLSAVADKIINQNEDQLLVVDIGADDIDWATQLSCIGKIWTPQVRSRII